MNPSNILLNFFILTKDYSLSLISIPLLVISPLKKSSCMKLLITII